MRRALSVPLPEKDRRALEALFAAPGTSARLRARARIVLRAAEGQTNQQIARELTTDPGTVGRWRRRYLLHGIPGILKDSPRPGRPVSIPDSKWAFIRAARERPAPSGARWSTRSLARETGLGKSTIQRIWRAREVRPRLTVDPGAAGSGMRFVEKVVDMVGLYLDSPERAIAFATDERIRTPRLWGSGHQTLATFRRENPGVEFRAFLQVIDRETPGPLDVHLLVDGRLAPLTPELERWLSHHPRFHLHYLPWDRSGLTLLDRLVARFSQRSRRRGEPPSAQRLRHAIREHFQTGREPPGPFVWTTAPRIVIESA